MVTALAGLVAAISFAMLLFPIYGHVGIAAAIAISGWVGALLLGIRLIRYRRLHIDDEGRRRLPLIAFATVMMGIVTLGAQKLLETAWDMTVFASARAGLLIILVVLGLATYGAVLHFTKAVKFRDLLAAIRLI